METQVPIPTRESKESPATKADLLRWIEAGERLECGDFSGMNLVGIALPKLNFKGANFQKAELSYANFAGAIFEGANLQGANLIGADFRGANLRNANFEGAALDNADLLKADLRNANLKHATLTHSSLRAADVSNADFSNADLQGINLTGAQGCLSAKFNHADLRGARGKHTGLDEHELKDKGIEANVDPGMSARGFYKRVFDFFDVEFPKTLKENIMYLFRIQPKKK